MSLRFPPPTQEAESIDAHAKLALFPRVLEVDCEWPAGEIGVRRRCEDVGWRLAQWEIEDRSVQVTVRADMDASNMGSRRARAVLKGPGGVNARGRAAGARWDEDGLELVWHFNRPNWEPETLKVTGWVGLGPPRYAEFTIKDIPLP